MLKIGNDHAKTCHCNVILKYIAVLLAHIFVTTRLLDSGYYRIIKTVFQLSCIHVLAV